MTSGTTLAIEFIITFPNSAIMFAPIDNANSTSVLKVLGFSGNSWSPSGITVVASDTAQSFRWFAMGY